MPGLDGSRSSAHQPYRKSETGLTIKPTERVIIKLCTRSYFLILALSWHTEAVAIPATHLETQITCQFLQNGKLKPLSGQCNPSYVRKRSKINFTLESGDESDEWDEGKKGKKKKNKRKRESAESDAKGSRKSDSVSGRVSSRAVQSSQDFDSSQF